MKYEAHETAIIDKGAEIGSRSKIWHWVHVCGGAKIGSDVSLGQNVFVGNKVIIGNNCKIQNNVSIYDNVYLDEGVFCGPSMVFTNVYNPRSLINRKDEYQDTHVKGCYHRRKFNNYLWDNNRRICFHGAGAVVNKDVAPYALVVGVPAKHIGWVSEYGERLDLPIMGNGKATCKHTGKKYELKNSKLLVI